MKVSCGSAFGGKAETTSVPLYTSDKVKTLLRYEGIPMIRLYPQFFSSEEAEEMFRDIDKECNWIISKVRIAGKLIPECRETCMQAVKPTLSYTYSGMKREAQPVSEAIERFCDAVGRVSQDKSKLPNLFLMNRYTMDQYICEHADDEKQMDQTASIWSLSLGQPRILVIREKRNAFNAFYRRNHGSGFKPPRRSWRLEIPMRHGSMLEFCPGMQQLFSHEVIKPRKSKGEVQTLISHKFPYRINVTGRHFE